MTDTDALASLTDDDVRALDAWFRAANYLTVAQIYLQDNVLLERPLTPDDIKPRLLGHWGTGPGQALVYAHMNRLIRLTGQQAIYLSGPGHGGPTLVGAGWLEDTYSEVYPDVTRDGAGMKRLCRQFSSPGGIPSHVSVTTPGSIHEGGELGYALVHAFGSVFDNPDLLSVCVVGDGEAETGPLEGSWKGISFLNPERDGAVLPILHLNGAKIASPTVLARKSPEDVRALFTGHGYDVIEVEGDDLPGMHHRFAAGLAEAYGKIRAIQTAARDGSWDGAMPRWPMIVLRSPKGWTGPKTVDGVQVEGTWRAHQVPLSGVKENADHLRQLEEWMRSYDPDELFPDGIPNADIDANNPAGELRMSANPAANGGVLTEDLRIRPFRDYALDVTSPASTRVEGMRQLGAMLADFYRDNPETFRLFCPDETNSNRLGAVFDVSDRMSAEVVTDEDVKLSKDGRVMEVLSEHNCQGWLEAYTLTGRHGMFATYEAFAMVSASMTVQHAKWLEEANHLPWRAKIPSLNILLTSTTWRNDHNGFSHQGPGLINVVLNMRSAVARVYLPPDANCMLSVADHCFRSRNYVNLLVMDKQPHLQYLTMDEAVEHCTKGAGIWEWAGNETGTDGKPDIVLACAGDVVTAETVAAAELLKEWVPDLSVRVVNVVDLMTLPRQKDHPHGMSEADFRGLFTDDVDVVFAFHGYHGAIHKLVHGRPKADRFHVRGFIEQGTTTTPFDMTVLNEASRYHLAVDALNNTDATPANAQELREHCAQMLEKHHAYVREHLQDMPEVRDWVLGQQS
ncbi:xylulose-5-phosphate/fructose-6-phosphate phosphoketolase [Mumia flava]|uniref:Xylulose-5-phosphate/fructose-6-phosphate phosphoketolase n=1 Tax=Mumia flava TaxID=1348852 RepID=A0A0B2B2P0_9ACTN|nr:phosphoketolase family protein [Mumia flava]PJJ56693.1 xylulose-5-phosphate/fructose-6-phosphate phosphoketolase [Mumia flava]